MAGQDLGRLVAVAFLDRLDEIEACRIHGWASDGAEIPSDSAATNAKPSCFTTLCPSMPLD